ncbi:MAG: GNAT family N-acetyltransferase [Pseudonocardiaceae bacterium]
MHIDLRLLTGQPCEMASLQRILEAAPTDAELVTGHPPDAADAKSVFSALPSGMTYDSKYLYGFMTDGPQMVGCADVIRGWPAPDTALLGLLLLDEAHQGHDVGTSGYHEIEAKVRQWPEIEEMRVAVVHSDAAVLPFWRDVGFAETGEITPHVYDTLTTESIILAKPLR